MDYREHFAQLLEHSVGEISPNYGRHFPVDDSNHGGISITAFPPSGGPCGVFVDHPLLVIPLPVMSHRS